MELRHLRTLAERVPILAKTAHSMVHAASIQDNEGGGVAVQLPKEVEHAVQRLDDARLKLEWLEDKVEEVTKFPLEAPQNKAIREVVVMATESVATADADHQHILLYVQNKLKDMEPGDTSGTPAPAPGSVSKLKNSVARTVVLVDGVGHLLDAASGGELKMLSLADEALALEGAHGSIEYKRSHSLQHLGKLPMTGMAGLVRCLAIAVVVSPHTTVVLEA